EALGALRWIGAHALASIVAVSFLTYLHVVFGEMVPKSLALQSPGAVAMAVAVPMRALELAFYPLVIALNGIGNGILRLFGVDRTAGGEERYRSADEIAYIVAESRAGGMLAREPARVIQELLEFGDLTAGEVMVPRTRMVALPLGADAQTIAALLRQEPHTRYPVVDGSPDEIVGVVHVKDLLRGVGPGARLERDLARPVLFVPATEPLDEVLSEMRREKAQMVVVMDEHGGTAGILTLEDLFEEVVGELGDPSRHGIVRREGGGTRVAGTARLEELGESLGLVLEHPEVDTVSGLVLYELGRPPAVGDRVTFEDVELEVTAVRGRGVQEARVVSAPSPP
ncbi:MAG: hemolysin family protein, partial [Gemmatimonadetes bacterium]|nr:hemolysin family protein [Gemmatimonadota bacterium]